MIYDDFQTLKPGTILTGSNGFYTYEYISLKDSILRVIPIFKNSNIKSRERQFTATPRFLEQFKIKLS